MNTPNDQAAFPAPVVPNAADVVRMIAEHFKVWQRGCTLPESIRLAVLAAIAGEKGIPAGPDPLWSRKVVGDDPSERSAWAACRDIAKTKRVRYSVAAQGLPDGWVEIGIVDIEKFEASCVHVHADRLSQVGYWLVESIRAADRKNAEERAILDRVQRTTDAATASIWDDVAGGAA